MRSKFTAIIYKTGINLCVDVPGRITSKMVAVKGYIPVKGEIEGHPYIQTLVPVKNGPYRLFVNSSMLKGSGTGPGDKARFSIEADAEPKKPPMPDQFRKKLLEKKLMPTYSGLTPSRQKEILSYLNHLKTPEALARNIDKVILRLRTKN